MAKYSINGQLQKQMNEFPGLITKLGKGKIKVETFSSEAIDTNEVIDLLMLKN